MPKLSFREPVSVKMPPPTELILVRRADFERWRAQLKRSQACRPFQFLWPYCFGVASVWLGVLPLLRTSTTVIVAVGGCATLLAAVACWAGFRERQLASGNVSDVLLEMEQADSESHEQDFEEPYQHQPDLPPRRRAATAPASSEEEVVLSRAGKR